MKFKYCVTLTVILLILFSLTTVVASEDITNDMSSQDALAIDVSDSFVCVDEDLNDYKSQDNDDNPLSADESTDLSVRIDGENIYVDDKFNRAGYEVPWTVTAIVDGGVAKNVKVNVVLSKYLEPLSINPNMGTFDPSNGIWDIGDLSSSDNASLSILTKLKSDGRFKVTADATTTSNDVDLSNNDAALTLKSGTGKKPSNTTSTSDNKGGGSENPGSDPDNPFVVVEPDDPVDEPTEKPPDEPSKKNNNPSKPNKDPSKTETNGQPNQNSDGSSSNDDGKNEESEGNVGVAKSTMSFSNAITEAFGSLGNIFNSDSNDDSSNPKDHSSYEVEKAIVAQDYTKIPILIFAFVLIAVAGIVGYDKIKA